MRTVGTVGAVGAVGTMRAVGTVGRMLAFTGDIGKLADMGAG